MKRVLGLDLGTNSIGWAVILVDDQNIPMKIEGMGSRIIPLSPDDANEFCTGNAISKNQKRTGNKTQRKGYDRYQQRRYNLTLKLRELGMLPDDKLMNLPVLELWRLRADAATKGVKLSLPEIGRVLYHLNQKRGYKHAKADESNEDKKQKEYVSAINERYASIREKGETIGQYFVSKLKSTEIINKDGKKLYTYRIKEQVFPRQAYEAEFDRIMECQREFYPDVLTNETIYKIRNEIIYYQRKLKSCKHLVSICEFEKRPYLNKDGKTVFDGPKVAPCTSPLFQVCKIWESVNALTLRNKVSDELVITKEQRREMFKHLDSHLKLTLTDMYAILGISKRDGWWGGKAIGKGLQGNITKIQLKEALQGYSETDNLLRFNLTKEDGPLVDIETGEMVRVVTPGFQDEPLYKLWHTIYSINDKQELENALKKKFGIEDKDVVNRLYRLDFSKLGFGNKSAKAIRRILPYLEEGLMYSDACCCAGFRHSDSLTKAENEARELLDKLPPIEKNALRQPVVEKILNQMVNVVNAVIDEYQKIDEIRVELTRELKQSREERNTTDQNIRRRERENANIIKKIEEFPDIRASRNRILKYRMWEEAGQKCFYCGQPVNAKEFLAGFDVEKEHIIPKSLLFDNSFSNQVCSCRKCNREKGNSTAYDYMSTKPDAMFNDYLTRIDLYYKEGKISKSKREKLLMPKDKIPTDFIDRQLRLSQYISRKSIEILKQVCRNVFATSGSVTDFLRHTWGYDKILHDLNFERYAVDEKLTEDYEYEHCGQKHIEKRIVGWSKRWDHRHHAIDALTIACTRQSMIQRLNTLNTERDAMFAEVELQSGEWKDKRSLLEQWVIEQKPFSTAEVMDRASRISVSFKAGKKVATPGKRFKYVNNKKVVLQTGIIIPRGALSESSVYGQIKVLEKHKPIKYIFENPTLIVKYRIKQLVEERIKVCGGDVRKAVSSLKGDPIFLDKAKTIKLEYATCYKQEFVKKYPVGELKLKDIDSVVDEHVRQVLLARLKEFNNNEKEAFKDLVNNPIYVDEANRITLKTVRCLTGLSAVEPVSFNSAGEPIGFVKPGNNHHIAIYLDDEGKEHEHVVTFWHAVERRKYGIPVVITNPLEVWDKVGYKELPESFLSKLPDINWKYSTSFQLNDMFILGLPEDLFQDAIKNNDYVTLNKYLYRTQKYTTKEYCFRLHTETTVDDKYAGVKNEMLSKQLGKLKKIQSLSAWKAQNPHKVRVSLLGNISIL